MKILILNPFKNNWGQYMVKYFNDRGHKCILSNNINPDALAFADVVICGWANEFAEHISRQIPKYTKYICFIRSYEIFHGYLPKMDWTVFDKVILVNGDFKPIVESLTAKMDEKYRLDMAKVETIWNGIDLDKWPFKPRQPGKKIGFVANIGSKKGIELLAQIMIKLPRYYELYILGQTEELRFGVYLEHILAENKIKAFIDNKTDDVAGWMANKNYIISTSPIEGNPNNVIEAMACGIKPVIHNWPGAKKQFPNDLIFDTVEQAVDMIVSSDKYDSGSYREFVRQNYEYTKVYKKLEDICASLIEK